MLRPQSSPEDSCEGIGDTLFTIPERRTTRLLQFLATGASQGGTVGQGSIPTTSTSVAE